MGAPVAALPVFNPHFGAEAASAESLNASAASVHATAATAAFIDRLIKFPLLLRD
jgi:hypothetical protein